MNKIKIGMLAVILIFGSNCLAKENSPFKVVQDLFAAMSAVNHSKMKSLVTEDFQLLEVGEDWTIDDLIEVVQPSEYKRRNYFGIIRNEVSGKMAWISYWNKATFTKGVETKNVAWLESAVLIKGNAGWKLKMLHSTRIKSEQISKNIELIEYVE